MERNGRVRATVHSLLTHNRISIETRILSTQVMVHVGKRGKSINKTLIGKVEAPRNSVVEC